MHNPTHNNSTHNGHHCETVRGFDLVKRDSFVFLTEKLIQCLHHPFYGRKEEDAHWIHLILEAQSISVHDWMCELKRVEKMAKPHSKFVVTSQICTHSSWTKRYQVPTCNTLTYLWYNLCICVCNMQAYFLETSFLSFFHLRYPQRWQSSVVVFPLNKRRCFQFSTALSDY